MITRLIDRRRDQRGVTGLETAIILIAFVVVASVFAYTVLSAGIFSAEKGKEAIHSGLEVARSSMELVGPVVAKDNDADGSVDEIIFIIANALDGEPLNLVTTTDADADGLLSDEDPKLHTTVISYIDTVQEVTDIAWTTSELGQGDGDTLLEAGEKFEITVNVANLTTRINANDTFTLEMKPAKGSSLIIERTTPAVIDKVMDLN